MRVHLPTISVEPAMKNSDDHYADQPWSNATWGWIAGIALVVVVMVFAFGHG